MHPSDSEIDLLLFLAIPVIAIFSWYIGPAVNGIGNWLTLWRRESSRIADSRATEMWRDAERGAAGDELPPPPPRGLRLVGKDRGQWER